VIELLVLSLLTLALGSLICLPLIGVKEIGRGFFTLWVVVIGVLGTIAFLLIAPRASPGAAAAPLGGDPARTALLLGVCLALVAVFWALLRWTRPAVATPALLLAAACGALVLRETALPGPPASEQAALRVTSLIVSAMAVGIVTVAMVLGHWYLVQPKLALAPLRRLCDVFVGVLIARLLVSGWGFLNSVRAGIFEAARGFRAG